MKEHNTFLHIDALEYASTWEQCQKLPTLEIKKKAMSLCSRMGKIEGKGEEIPSYLLAAYRAYENALLFRELPHTFADGNPIIVKLYDAEE